MTSGKANDFPVAMFKPIDDWMRRRLDLSTTTVHPGSSLAGDDRWATPYHVSHTAWHRLGSAVDNLGTIKSLIVDARVLPTFGIFSLLRPAMENAMSVIWLLCPPSRAERVLRRLRIEASNVRNHDKALSLLNVTPGRPLKDRLEDLRDVATRHNLSAADAVDRLEGWLAIVREAGDYTGFGANRAELMWRSCSAFSHGDQWPALGMLARIGPNDGSTDILDVELTASAESVLPFLRSTIMLTSKAFDLHDQRRRPTY